MGGNLWVEHVTLVTGRGEPAVIEDADLIIEDGRITYTGSALSEEMRRQQSARWAAERDPDKQYRIIDGRHRVVYPGLVNTHHHMYQSLTRNLPAVENMGLFEWLHFLFPVWCSITEEMVYYGSLVTMAELLKSGCTTTMDHHYVFPKGQKRCLDWQFRAAAELGIRFHGSRGSMSVGQEAGGLPPAAIVEDPDTILAETERVIQAYHDQAPYAMQRVVVAPCAPTSVSSDLFKELAQLARRYHVHLHTHLAETLDEDTYCQEHFGKRPLAYMEELGWVGSDVWFAHAVHLNEEEIARMAETATGMAHCPSSNMKLHSGVARIQKMAQFGVPVSLGVDGSASNDSSNMLAEVRMAYLLHVLSSGEDALSASHFLQFASVGGARVLGRDDLGSLEVGKAGDCFLIRMDYAEFAGAGRDLTALPATLGIHRPVEITIVNGFVVYEEGQFRTGFDESEAVKKVNQLCQRLV